MEHDPSRPRRLLQRFAVEFEHALEFTQDVFAPTNMALLDAVVRKQPQLCQRCLFIVEERVVERWPELIRRIEAYAQLHAMQIELAAAPLVVTGGEAAKHDSKAVTGLYAQLMAAGVGRDVVVVVVGGGALQDLAGYAAATLHGGLRVVRIPTTVLSQAHSGVGVKSALHAFGQTNVLGTCSVPLAVLIDSTFLSTLPARDAIAGLAEAVKVALLKDADFFAWLEREATALASLEHAALVRMIRRAALLHLDHIATSGDPFELGSARPLVFGEWIARKLEQMTGHRLNHGETVAIGTAVDTRYSAEAGLLDCHDVERALCLLEQLGLPLWDPALSRKTRGQLEVLAGIEEFRRQLDGEPTITMLRAIGCGREVHVLNPCWIRASLEYLRARTRARAADEPAIARSANQLRSIRCGGGDRRR